MLEAPSVVSTSSESSTTTLSDDGIASTGFVDARERRVAVVDRTRLRQQPGGNARRAEFVSMHACARVRTHTHA